MVKSYNFALLDEAAKREIRRKILKAIAIPGYQVPFGSRELPIARGWGTGGLQITLSIIGPDHILKVIDQGSDDSVNAINIKKLIVRITGVETTEDTDKATLVQTRHRIPEEPLRSDQVLVFQVPLPEPLRDFYALFHRGKKESIHFGQVIDDFLLVTVFGRTVSLGSLRMKTAQAIDKIENVMTKTQLTRDNSTTLKTPVNLGRLEAEPG